MSTKSTQERINNKSTQIGHDTITHTSCTHKLQVIQNKALRVIHNAQYNESASPIYRKLNIMTFDNMYKLESCKFM